MKKQANRMTKMVAARERREHNERVLNTLGIGPKPDASAKQAPPPKTGTLIFMFEWKRRRERIKTLIASIDGRMAELTAIAKDFPS